MTTCKKVLLTLIIFLNGFFIQNVFAQEPPTPKTIAELKSMLVSEMGKQHIAGMILTLVTHDSVLYAGGLGYANVEKKIPVTEKHLFRQASITKLFTALGILNLVNEGKLTVNTRLKDIAPEIPFENEWEKTYPVTIAHLMEHTTGFDDKTPLEEYNYSGEKISGLDALKVFKEFMKSKWKPGERLAYSGVNYAILAYVIEHISDQPFQEYLRQKVFPPLGMADANVYLSGDDSGAYSKGYVWKDNHYQYVPHLPQYNPGYGSLNANALDFAHALSAYLNDWRTPNGQFLTKVMLEDSETPHTYLSAQAGMKNTYAYGNENADFNGRMFRGHGGAIGGYLSGFYYNRELGLGYAFSFNTFNQGFHGYANDLINRFLTQNLSQVTKAATYPINKKTIESYLGYYRLSNLNHSNTAHFEGLKNTFKLEHNQDKLVANFLLGGSMVWKAADKSGLKFKNEWSSNSHILFLKDSDDNQVIVDNTLYIKKISAIEAWTPVVLLCFSLILLVSSLLFGIICILLFFFNKINRSTLLLRLSPAVSVLGLFMIIWASSKFFEQMSVCGPIYTTTFVWTLGKYIFALFSLGTLILLILRWKSIKSQWLKGYLTFVCFGGCYLLGLLVMNHWY